MPIETVAGKIRELFDDLDKDGSGALDAPEIKEVCVLECRLALCVGALGRRCCVEVSMTRAVITRMRLCSRVRMHKTHTHTHTADCAYACARMHVHIHLLCVPMHHKHHVQGFERLGKPMSDDQVREYISSMDTDNKGEISYVEFEHSARKMLNFPCVRVCRVCAMDMNKHRTIK